MGKGAVLLQKSGQLDTAGTNGGVEQPETVPAPVPEGSGEVASEDAAQTVPGEAGEAKPEDSPAPEASAPAQKKRKDPQKKAQSEKAQSDKKRPKKAPPKKKQPKSTLRLLVGFLIKIAVTAALIWATFTYVLGLTVHYGNNMYPALHDGDLVVSLRLQKPYINSVVLYRINGKTKVGRVIALEGSVVDIRENGAIIINGITPSEDIFYATYPAENSSVTFPYTVETGKVFILNDFRNDTNDSRAFGAVDKEDLEGPLLFTVRRRNF